VLSGTPGDDGSVSPHVGEHPIADCGGGALRFCDAQ
jgi:hypothetical protein